MEKLLKTHFGYDEFRPLQKEIIDTVMSGKDTLVLMPTGGGKSLCFQLPALSLPGITLVISPLIALMKDQVDALVANGISAAFLNSSITRFEQEEIMKAATDGDVKILYLAPERLNSYGFSDFLETLTVSLLAIDEAHCISEWGHDFRPDYRNLRSLRAQVQGTPVIALTATATPRVRKDILDQLDMKEDSVYISSFNRENLHYSVRSKFNATAQLVDLFKSHKGESAIVYCFSRKNTEEVANALNRSGIDASPYHAGLSKEDRMETQDQFIRDEVTVIVATIAFGMGIDKPDVRLVIHMDLPKTVEGYYQETGRAGRDGLPGECILFYTYADKRKQDYFINMMHNKQEKNQAIKKLDDVVSYCQSDECRRAELLRYFGEVYADDNCGSCDNCSAPPVEDFDATEVSQKIMSAVLRTGERFGAAYVCDVLRGSKKKQILEMQHDTLSVYGIARDLSVGALRSFTESLRKRGYLEKNEGEYPTLRVSARGHQALKQGDPIMLPKLNAVVAAPVKKSKSNLDYDLGVFEKLRTLRKKIADEQAVPPFVIFGDKSLHEMAYYLPSSLEAFSQLFGVGQKKLDAFGEDFLATIVSHSKEHGLEERQAPVRKVTSSIKKSTKSNTVEETRVLLAEKLSIDEIAKERGLSAGTIVAHIEKLVYSDEIPDIEHIKPKETEFKVMRDAFEGAGSTSLTYIFKKLDEKYGYDELRVARLFL
ncbi:DNA helicase RecQ [Candidatus Uhrbacteria bacterium]|jgi:ATP-dependent DNA helicase RecQ|nr:DNA helicase RecQ [Candidatus Uhrbacteria bacterium]